MLLIEKVGVDQYTAAYSDADRNISWKSERPMGRYELQDMLIVDVGAYPVDVIEALEWASVHGRYYHPPL